MQFLSRPFLVFPFVLLILFISGNASAEFNWGGNCDTGGGEFNQPVADNAVLDVGTIPSQKRNVQVSLTSLRDVDIQLIDVATGQEIIAWPNGTLNGASEACTIFHGVEICYSGYNGNQTPQGHGNEWIEVRGDTPRALAMKVFGYQAGTAHVTYSYEALTDCEDSGSGEFDQWLARNQITLIGDIPAGKSDISIQLTAQADLDIQLYHGNVALVKWPDGILNGSSQQSLEYNGVTIVWSGYNGNGTGAGNESIEIHGTLNDTLTMKAFGYQSGQAHVAYSWGTAQNGSTGVEFGGICGGYAGTLCAEGLSCDYDMGSAGHCVNEEPEGYGSSDPQACNGVCWYGAHCTDYCPPGASCVKNVYESPNFWEVLGCGVY